MSSSFYGVVGLDGTSVDETFPVAAVLVMIHGGGDLARCYHGRRRIDCWGHGVCRVSSRCYANSGDTNGSRGSSSLRYICETATSCRGRDRCCRCWDVDTTHTGGTVDRTRRVVMVVIVDVTAAVTATAVVMVAAVIVIVNRRHGCLCGQRYDRRDGSYRRMRGRDGRR